MLGGVTDTHALLWFVTGKLEKLGTRARKIFEAADRKDGSGLVTVPAIVLHEISWLITTKDIKLAVSFSDWVRQLEKHGFFPILNVDAEAVIRSADFQQITDPFDRLIMGCAALLEQPLITTDQKITQANVVEVLWE